MNSTLTESVATFVMLSVATLYLALRRERGTGYWLLFALLISMMVWTGGLSVFWLVERGEVARFALTLVFLAVFTVPPCWLLLAAHLTHVRLFDQRPGWLIAVLVPSAMSMLAVVTNSGHRMFVRDFDREVLAGAPADWAGPLLWAGIGFGILQVLIGSLLYLGVAWRTFSNGQRARGLMLAAVVVLPLAASPVVGVMLQRDITPSMIALTTLLLFAVNWRHRVLEALPIARRDVIEHLPEGVVLLDVAGCVLDANPSAERILGASVARLKRRPLAQVLRDLATPVEASGVEAVVTGMVSGGPAVLMEFEAVDERVLEINAARVQGGVDPAAGYYALLRDRTEHKRYEKFLRQSNRLETVASLSAGIAHEVNNPLTFVRANINHILRIGALLAEDSRDGSAKSKDELDELRQVAEESLDGIDRIARTIDRMRRFSRLKDGELERVALNDVVHDALRMARVRSGPGLEVETTLASGLPPVHGSTEHLVQAVLILVVNARQALAGRSTGKLSIQSRREGRHVVVHVRDNGPGIPEEIQERIFDPFFTTKESGEGTGLGLAIASGIVREHGGVLDLESTEGTGCDFVIRMPVHPEAVGADWMIG